MPTAKIDGREVTVEKGRTIIQVCEQLGIEVPRYCYHPGLRIVGSCRMCLVQVEKMPKLQVACSTPVQDGMVVWTNTEEVQQARRSVLEFLLLNHPLDCPVCDRSGECELQNFYFKHALHSSRLRENKMKRRKAYPIGPHVILDQERCVLCSRCVRFTKEVTKTGELGIFNKGTWSEINIFPGKELNNNYSGNVVDICPVGALLDRDFRYQMSVWFLKEGLSICPGCSNGCNIRIHYALDRPYKAQGRRVMRLKPRYNENVNRWWMCDEGRYNYRWIDLDRIEEPALHSQQGMQPVEWNTIIGSIAEKIRKTIDQHGPGSVGVVASPRMTNEELFLARKIFYEKLNIPLLHFAAPPAPNAAEDDFLLKKDKNPNSRGAELILSEQQGMPVEAIVERAREGKLRLIYVFHANLVEAFGMDRVREAMNMVDTVIYQGSNNNEFLQFTSFVLAEATYAEKDGTFTNFQGRVQRIFQAIPPLTRSRASVEILADLGKALGIEMPAVSAPDVFLEMASRIPAFAGMSYATIGLSGQPVRQEPHSAAAAD
jgi:NADH-quinone oxidoreductase subunit G